MYNLFIIVLDAPLKIIYFLPPFYEITRILK